MKIELYNEDCYQGIKKIPDKSIDLVYIDIPYDLEGNGGGCFGSKKRDYHKEYEKVSQNTNASPLSIRKANNNNNISDIAFGVNYSILNELCRVMKHIYIYGVVKNKYLFF